MISVWSMSIAQLRDPRFRRVLWFGIALAIALLFAMYAVVLLVVQLLMPGPLFLPISGEVQGLSSLFSIGSILYLTGLSVFLMVPVASAFTGLYLDDVADAVEAEHYPGLPPRNRVPFGEAWRDALNYFGLLIILNFVGMAAFAVSGGFGIVALWALNGFLLSREYFTMIARRRHDPDAARALQKRHALRLWVPGVVMAVGLTVPVINLILPLLGAAVFTHMYNRLNPASPASSA
jgi:CysZ protein